MSKNNSFYGSREELVSMFLGLGVVILVVLIIFTIIQRGKGSVSVPGQTSISEETLLTTPGKLRETGNIESYEVKAGDSLWKISKKVYGDGDAWTKIAAQNKMKTPSYVEVGQKLVMPTMTPVLSKISDPIKSDNVVVVDSIYQVKAGDSLWKIAETKLGSGYKWVQIWNLNKNVIVNSNQLEVGMVIKLK